MAGKLRWTLFLGGDGGGCKDFSLWGRLWWSLGSRECRPIEYAGPGIVVAHGPSCPAPWAVFSDK